MRRIRRLFSTLMFLWSILPIIMVVQNAMKDHGKSTRKSHTKH